MHASLVIPYGQGKIKERYSDNCEYSYEQKRYALTVGEVLEIKAVNQYYYLIDSEYSELISIISDDERVYNPTDPTQSSQQDEHFGYLKITNLATRPITVQFMVFSVVENVNCAKKEKTAALVALD